MTTNLSGYLLCNRRENGSDQAGGGERGDRRGYIRSVYTDRTDGVAGELLLDCGLFQYQITQGVDTHKGERRRGNGKGGEEGEGGGKRKGKGKKSLTSGHVRP